MNEQQQVEMQMQQMQAMQSAAAGIGIVFTLVYLAVLVLIVASMWKIFSKAGQPGWAAIVPIYNLVVYMQIVGKPVWWIVLMFVPLVNIVIAFIVMIELAKVFGKGTGFAIGLIFLPIIFMPMLAFGSAQYQGPATSAAPGGIAPAM